MASKHFLKAALSSFVALTLVALAPQSASADTSPMSYHQGPVITDPLVYVVFWGPEWQNGFVDPTDSRYTGGQAITYITRMFTDMGGSPWLNTITQYSGIHNPTNLYQPNQTWTDPSPLPSSFQESSVEGEAIAAADHFNLYSANVIWFIFTAPNKRPSDMPSSWCGYHDYLIGSNQTFAYIPYAPTMTNCYTNSAPPSFSNDSFGHGHFDGFSITGGHELAEAITDPYFDGWCRDIVCGFLNRSDEIGDLCESSQGNSYGQTWMHDMYYAVQGLWSNSSASCALPAGAVPSPYPTCTLASISANPASQATGNQANFRGLASCPTPTYQFQVRSSSGALIVTQPYGLEWTFGWTATVPGSYTIEVDARDNASTANGFESNSIITYPFIGCSAATLSVLNGPPVITLKGAANCPGTPTYRFWIRPPGGSWGIVQDFGTSSTYIWNTPGLPGGAYSLEVDVRDQGATSSYEAAANTTYNLVPPPTGVLIAENSSYTWIAHGSRLEKFDLGGFGANMFSTSTSGTTGPHAYGYVDMGASVTALAINESYLYIGLSTGRVIKTNMCGNGPNVCAFSDNMGGGTIGVNAYWQGYQDYSLGRVTALASNSSYLYASFGTRTVKTTLCATGAGMCRVNSVGTASVYPGGQFYGYQDWSAPVVAEAANDSYVFTSMWGNGLDRVCKTNIGSSGGDVFALSSGACTGSYPGYSDWYGYQDLSSPAVGLAVDGSHVYWSLGTRPRLFQTNMCGTGGNVCALSDGYGTGTLSGYHYWVGEQDICSGYQPASVASSLALSSYVDWAFGTGSGNSRVIQATPGTGGNMFATGDCTGTFSLSGWNYWVGYQNLSI